MKLYNEEIRARAGLLSSLEKVFPDQVEYPEIRRMDAFRGERVHVQAAFCSCTSQYVSLHVHGPLARYATIHSVVYVPCLNPAVAEDSNIISSKPGLYPGPLVKENTAWFEANRVSAFWITLDLPKNTAAGESELDIELEMKPYWGTFPSIHLPIVLNVHRAVLPPQRLACEMWFHGDCLLKHYNVKVWSPEYWKLLENCFRDMTKHGLNVLLTPLWSLPLDTAPGGERPTVQLLSITRKEDGFHFDFRRLQQWIDTARKCGFRKFSFSHLFTQWGLEKTPKIMVRENGCERRMFGWDVPSDSPEYRRFLTQLFGKLLPFLRKNGLSPDNVYFHLSDEPNKNHVAKYRECSLFVRRLLQGYRTLDAMSDVDFYDQGLVDCPVASECAIEPFMERPIPERWLYYCGEWATNVPNRKLGMASIRNRILGVILYLYQMNGFLEWGYNFWFSFHSIEQKLNPFDVRFITRIYGNNGGAFAVLPGDDGKPVSTVHYEVFADALQDLRLLQLLENRIGRDAVVRMIQSGRKDPITIHDWPNDPEWLFDLRRRIALNLDETDNVK